MSRRAAYAAAAIVVAVLLGVAGMALWPVSASGYQDRVVGMAQGALSAVRTVAVLGKADAEHRVLAPYAATVLDSAREAVATSQSDLAVEPVNYVSSAGLRGELAGLLDRAAALLADDGVALSSVEVLGQLGDELESFVERNR